MTPFQSALLHLVVALAAIASATVLAVTVHITGGEAIGVVIAAAGISGTGIAGVTSVASSVTSSTPAKPAATAVPAATAPSPS